MSRELVVASAVMQGALELARRAQRSSTNLLITGDPGVGKTTLARWAASTGDALVIDELAGLTLEDQAALLASLDAPARPRVIAATRDPGALRPDLYYALSVIRIRIPPLRERPDDIRALVAAFLARAPRPLAIADEALRYLVDAPWEGNVRELASTIDRAVALCERSVIGLADVSPIGPRVASAARSTR